MFDASCQIYNSWVQTELSKIYLESNNTGLELKTLWLSYLWLYTWGWCFFPPPTEAASRLGWLWEDRRAPSWPETEQSGSASSRLACIPPPPLTHSLPSQPAHYQPRVESPGTGCIVTMSHFPIWPLHITHCRQRIMAKSIPHLKASCLISHRHRSSDTPHHIIRALCHWLVCIQKSRWTTYEYPDNKEQPLLGGVMLSMRACWVRAHSNKV